MVTRNPTRNWDFLICRANTDLVLLAEIIWIFLRMKHTGIEKEISNLISLFFQPECNGNGLEKPETLFYV